MTAPYLHPQIMQVYHSVSASMKLQKLASLYPDNDDLQEKIGQLRDAVEEELFSLTKTAGISTLLRNAGTGVGKWYGRRNPLTQSALLAAGPTAIVGGTGYGVGSSLLDQAHEQAKDLTADIRNKVLQGAAGAAGIGLGAYGLHQLMSGDDKKEEQVEDESKQEGSSPLGFLPGIFGKKSSAVKTAAEERETVSDAIEKLATVGAIEAVLDQEIENGDEERSKTAEELRRINRGYGVRILFDLCSG